ncbi:MAG: apolipoprotein N-acyltransferase [Treponemataceae bacterium]
MSIIAALTATVASSAVLALALPNEFAFYGIPILGAFCLAPYFAAIQRTKSYRSAALLGFFFGTLSHALSSYWLFFFRDFAFWTLGSSSIAYGGLHALLAAYLRRFSFGRESDTALVSAASAEKIRTLRPFLIAATWTVWEWSKSTGFLGYPWGLVAYAVNEVSVLTQIADATGVYGLSFLLALTNALLAETSVLASPAFWSLGFPMNGGITADSDRTERRSLFNDQVFRSFAVLGLIALWFSAYGVFRLSHPTPTVDTATVVLVQHNGDSWAQGGEIAVIKKCEDLTRKGMAKATAEGKKPVLVAWSETVLRRPYNDYKPFFRKNPPKDPLIPFFAETGVPLLTGAPVVLNWETYDATNSALLIDPEGAVLFSYAKSHPVPFAESIPFWEYQWMRDFMSKVVGLEGGWVMGTEATVMEVKTPSGRPLRFGVPICFEDAFASVCAGFFKNGADILINLTNDSWSKTVSAETQHFVVARFRAIENRRVLVRSTNGGVTAIVNAEGKTIASLPLFTENTLVVDVPIQKSSASTTYFILGDWFPALMAFCLFLVVVWDFSRTRRKETQPSSELIPDEE